tara:strand:- start:4641 stop:5759 length:1119 start_codon:yes stop_codon:yes gene_type:complete
MSAYLISAASLAQPYDAGEQGRFVIAGYGDVKYEESDLLDSSAFSARFVPIFLFSLNDKMHVEAETEISLNEAGETEVELEYADIHYFLTDTTTVTAGKFLLPFGQFSANFHPSWINRTPWTPGIYGSHGSAQAMTPLLPILSDVGIAVQQTFFFTSQQKIFLDLYVTNGARAEAHNDGDEIIEDHAEDEEVVDEHTEAFPEVEFAATSGDNNKNKAFGGRIAYAFLPAIEIGASYYTAKYDEEERLSITAQGMDINVIGSRYLIRGEYILTETDGLEEADEHAEETINAFKRNGWYLQGVLQAGQIWPQLGGTELVVEYAKTNKFAKAKRWVAGLNYWLDPRSVIKFSYEETDIEEGDDDQRLAVQYSYGF